jgi:cytidylate kinase
MALITRTPGGHKDTASLAERRMREWAMDLEVRERRMREPSKAELRRVIQPYVAISRETGAGGEAIGARVGEMLRCDVLDRELLDEMAARYKLPRYMLDLVDENTSNWFTETFGKWIDQKIVTQSEYIVHLGHLVLLAAQHASTVFVGRGAQFVLPAEKGLTVYIVAPLKMRIEYVGDMQKCTTAKAAKYIKETDKGRHDFVKKYFHRDIGEEHLYDLVINRSHVSIDGVAELIADQWRRRFASK